MGMLKFRLDLDKLENSKLLKATTEFATPLNLTPAALKKVFAMLSAASEVLVLLVVLAILMLVLMLLSVV